MGLFNCGHYSGNTCGDEQNKKRWRMQNLASVNIDMGTYKNIPVRKKLWGLRNLVLEMDVAINVENGLIIHGKEW